MSFDTSCWHKIDLSIDNALKINPIEYIEQDPYREDEICFYDPGKSGVWRLNSQTSLNQEWIDYIKEHTGLEIAGICIFWKRANFQEDVAHVDLGFKDEQNSNTAYPIPCALNWVYGDDTGQMVWYKLPRTIPQFKISSSKNSHMSWNLDSLTQVDKSVVGNKLTLCRTNIPHSIDMGNKDRWLISARVREDKDFDSWEQSLNVLDKYIIK